MECFKPRRQIFYLLKKYSRNSRSGIIKNLDMIYSEVRNFDLHLWKANQEEIDKTYKCFQGSSLLICGAKNILSVKFSKYFFN